MKLNKKSLVVLSVFAGLFFSSVCALSEDINIPAYRGYVNDFAHLLKDSTNIRLTALAGEVEKKTGAQMAIVTLKTTKPFDIELYAVKLFEKWGIGQKGKDNGVLLLIAVDDHKVRIEVGYGLEGAIPDALANVIINNYIVPSFKVGDFDTGILKGSLALAQLIAKEYNVELGSLNNMPVRVAVPQRQPVWFAILRLIFTILFIFIFLSMRLGFFWLFFMPGTFRRNGGYWYGGGYGGNSGGFTGGFGGFGGGLSGGGGSSGSW